MMISPKCWSGRAGKSKKLKIVALPKISCEIAVAVSAAAIAGSSTTAEKLWCNSSREKITPAKGALKAAASPALAPLVNK
ncbi:hypothetical protein SDC9_77359 [bioreactor metagenome]|uniref:Uncharacterized protein n=1 Tax=bioreactor metagenome TaxID=1076179 RepID=A0A644YR80_9ZZZZ